MSGQTVYMYKDSPELQRILATTTVFVTKDFAVKSNLLLQRNLIELIKSPITDTIEQCFFLL